ncbi:MAG TPA: OmpH family outer membrane protein [Pirellulales bacterium]|jgi:Skp family chaperone for outer membrane proteins|nr:OmpH family outer membrane protein [Pirellulales bacterium]
MRRNAILILFVFACAILSQPWRGLWPTAASEPAPAAPAASVALLDLAKIFQTHAGFKQQSDALRREVEQAERNLTERKAELKAAADSLAGLPKGSIGAKQLEGQIARDQADITVLVNAQKVAFFEQEAKMYYEVYLQVMSEVKKYAEPRGIKLVMRFNGDPYDENDPQALQKELNKAVLYHQGIDITDDIIAIVKSKPIAEDDKGSAEAQK